MRPKIDVDVDRQVVRVGDAVRKGQWFAFYALLVDHALSEQSEQWLTPQRLHEIGAWQRKKERSIGKEVARELRTLPASISRLIVHEPGITKAWRLRPVASRGRLGVRPSARALHDWLRSSSTVPVDDKWLEGLTRLVDVAIAVQSGKAEMALETLRAFDSTGLAESSLTAWAELLKGSAILQFIDAGQFSARSIRRTSVAGVLGDAVRDRLTAQRALASRFSTPRSAIRALGKIAYRIEARGDLATLGVVTNTLGILYRRIGHTTAAAAQHRRALGLASVSGDFRTVQAAIFNMALCRYAGRKEAGLPPDEHMIHLAELCERVANRFGVGNDSVQAPVTAAVWASQLGRCSDAQRYLQSAAGFIDRISSTWEQAYFHEARARVGQNCPSPGVDPPRDLRIAAKLFDKAGDAPAARRARERARQLFHTR